MHWSYDNSSLLFEDTIVILLQCIDIRFILKASRANIVVVNNCSRCIQMLQLSILLRL